MCNKDAWITSGGSYKGCMKLVGEAFKENALSLDPNQKVTVLGIPNWCSVAKYESLINEPKVGQLLFSMHSRKTDRKAMINTNKTTGQNERGQQCGRLRAHQAEEDLVQVRAPRPQPQPLHTRGWRTPRVRRRGRVSRSARVRTGQEVQLAHCGLVRGRRTAHCRALVRVGAKGNAMRLLGGITSKLLEKRKRKYENVCL